MIFAVVTNCIIGYACESLQAAHPWVDDALMPLTQWHVQTAYIHAYGTGKQYRKSIEVSHACGGVEITPFFGFVVMGKRL